MVWRQAARRKGALTGPPGGSSPPRPATDLGAPAGVIIGRRPRLPGSRAMVGGFLVAAAAVVVFATALSSGAPRQDFVIAAGNLPAGTVLGPGDTTVARMDLPAGTATLSFARTSAVMGRTLAVPLSDGELVESGMLSPAGGPPARPVSVAVDSDSLASLAPDEAVDVLEAPSTSPAATAAPTQAGITVVMRGATLLAVQRPSSGLLSSSTSATVVTLGVSNLAEAEQVMAAAHEGTLELIQAVPADGSGLGPGDAG